MNSVSTIEFRALELLGSGIAPETVANALGVTPSRISQLLSDEEFARKVTEKKFETLQKHNALIEKFQDVIPLMMRPMEILKALQVINSQKRRGVSSPESIHTQQTIVNLTVPVQLVTKFSRDINNQVIEAGDQTLLTIQSNKLHDLSRERKVEAKNGSREPKRIETSGRITADTINNL
jgi:hypothetical protein